MIFDLVRALLGALAAGVLPGWPWAAFLARCDELPRIERGERAGKKLEIDAIQVFHIRNGKISEAWTMHSDLYAVDEFWS